MTYIQESLLRQDEIGNTKIKSKKAIDKWLVELGYKESSDLYSALTKMSHKTPSYRLIADIMSGNISKHNMSLDSYLAWEYTKNLVNGLKSNGIKNNLYFQSIMKNGLINPKDKSKHDDVWLFDSDVYLNNNYFFVKDFWLRDEDFPKTVFDYTLVINGLPLILIETVDSLNNDSFEEAYERVLDAVDNYPMFFNYNKLIILTDGITFKIGTMFDLYEEGLVFNKGDDDESLTLKSLNQTVLDDVLKTENVVRFLIPSTRAREFKDHIEKTLNDWAINKHEETKESDNVIEYVESNEEELTTSTDYSNDEINHFREDELDFLSGIFSADLDEIIDSEEFKSKVESSVEVADFKHNKEYIKDYQSSGSEKTLNLLAKANQQLVNKVLSRYESLATTSVDKEDMRQMGYLGLQEAINRFDLSKDNELSTYAVHWIRQAISRGIENESLLIRLPVHLWSSINKLRNFENLSNIKFGRVDYDWISQEADLTREKISDLVEIRDTYMRPGSIDHLIGEEEDTALKEMIPDESISVEDLILMNDLEARLNECLDCLDQRSRQIIIKRYGLEDGECLTLEEIGKIHGVTRERIRQLEGKALKKLRRNRSVRKLKVYCEGD